MIKPISIVAIALFSFGCAVPVKETTENPPMEMQEVIRGLSLDGIVVENSKFEDVLKKFGPNEIDREGDAGNSRYFTCYLNKNSFIEFESGSEKMQGGTIVSSIKINRSGFKKCKRTEINIEQLKFQNGLGLGIASRQLIQILGKPKETKDNMHVFRFTKSRPDNYIESITVHTFLDEEQKVNEIRLYKVTSN